MDDPYEYLDFLSDNAIVYFKREKAISDVEGNNDELIERKRRDESELSPEDFFEKYYDEIPTLNGREVITEYENYLNHGLRKLRDTVHKKEFDPDPKNRNEIILNLQNSIRTLEFYRASFVSYKVKRQDTENVDNLEDAPYLEDDNDSNEEINIVNSLAPLLQYVNPKIIAIQEVLNLFSAEGGRSKPRTGRVSESDLTVNQLAVLFYHLMKHGVFSKDISQTTISEAACELTGFSNKTLRQAYSEYKSFREKKEAEAANVGFPPTDHAKVRRVMKEIMTDLERLAK